MVGSLWPTLLAAGLLAAEPAPEPPAPEGYRLVWHDEFDTDGLPNPERWGYEVGFVRNKESQFYTEARSENVRIENGRLIIEGRKEHYEADGKSSEYTSGSINTLGKISWLYGRLEVRAKLPRGRGVWPAIWMMGDNINTVGWPACGEIDVMEHVGKEPDNIYSTVHYPAGEGHKSSGSSVKLAEPWADFHTYRVDWTKDALDFFVDDRLIHHFDVSQAAQADGNPFQRPNYLLLNLALGGAWGGEIDDSVLPQRYEIDWVRVFQPS